MARSTPDQVRRCASEYRKIEHLGGKDESRQHAHHRDEPPGKRMLEPVRGIKNAGAGHNVQRQRHPVCEKAVRDMHGIEL